MVTATSTQLVLRRTFSASPERLFEAWTTPDILTKFLGPGEVDVVDVKADARVGGKYSITFRDSDGDVMVVGGVDREHFGDQFLGETWICTQHAGDEADIGARGFGVLEGL